jgi:hypothetical protein
MTALGRQARFTTVTYYQLLLPQKLFQLVPRSFQKEFHESSAFDTVTRLMCLMYFSMWWVGSNYTNGQRNVRLRLD